ncbi:putative T9SS type A sorting domain-containing protein [Tenacibaculum sp. 190524A02b]|uniref:T9SS type A sorting domain-containing protein n=1 Tax=Tenacibaculum vairaonense TaxID=3137860 RepID=A0ABM9PJC3_9FLAO
MKKIIAFLFLFIMQFVGVAQIATPAHQNVSVKYGETRIVYIDISSGRLDATWSISGAGALHISQISGTLPKYQRKVIPIIIRNNQYNTNITSTYIGTVHFRTSLGSFSSNFSIIVNYLPSCMSTISVVSNINSGQTHNLSAEATINATNIIHNNAVANYNAGSNVMLKPGFKSVSGSKFKAFIKGCTIARKVEGKENFASPEIEDFVINEVEEVKVYPNPFSTVLNISNTENIISWQLLTMQNKIIKFGEGRERQINTSNLLKGMYVMQFILKNGEILKKKLVKN